LRQSWAGDEEGGLSDTVKGAAAVGASTATKEAAGGADLGAAGKAGAAAAVGEALEIEQGQAAVPDSDVVKEASKQAAGDAKTEAAAAAVEKADDAVDPSVKRLSPMLPEKK
jgi:hypothetical protein